MKGLKQNDRNLIISRVNQGKEDVCEFRHKKKGKGVSGCPL